MKTRETQAVGTGVDNSPSWVSRIVFGRNPKRTAVRAVLLVILSLVVFKFVLLPIRVVGISMAPNYHHGQINFVNRLAYLKARPKRGDVVAIRINGERALLLKRVIGLPGETVAWEEGIVRINAWPLERRS